MAVLEGVLAIHKPSSISSFDVIRTVTPKFRQSPLFQPLIERSKANASQKSQKKKRNARLDELKIGHGGTLDPLATGVLIVGVGNGTKSLQRFLDGSKEYECTVLFGAATDSYDILGKVTKTASWDSITREKVEKALDTLRGPQMQLPPVYSAIRVDGKHLYDYAREGLPIPEIKRRSVTVYELEMLEYLEPDQHDFDLPSQEADEEAKIVADRVAWPKSLMNKRKRESEERDLVTNEPDKKIMRSTPPTETIDVSSEAKAASEVTVDLEAKANSEVEISSQITAEKEQNKAEDQSQADSSQIKSRPPAARLRMSVSSGFYVRSLCHDLGVALGSAGLMATLVRSRQSGFELGKNVIEYADFEKGPEVWEPQVQKSLEDWQAKEAEKGEDERRDERRRKEERSNLDRYKDYGKRRAGEWKKREARERRSHEHDRRRRNSSSVEAEKRRRRNSSSVE